MADVRLKAKVNELIHDDGDRERLFNALRRYQSGQILSRLLSDMQEILDDPSKLELFDHMRPLILLHHQVAYSQLVPSAPGVKVRIVRLHRTPYETLGFAVRGGLEHGVGVFVTDVKPGSQAHRQGLMVGDEILGVNGYTISEAIHEDVLSLIKSRDDIVLKVTHIGMFPTKEQANSDVKWKYTEKGTAEENMESEKGSSKDLKIFVDSTGHHSLGCGILSGPPHLPGIYVERVRPGSLAEEINLEPGDQIMEVNGTAFHRITHKEAVFALVSSRQLNMTIRKGRGLELVGNVTDTQPKPTAVGNETPFSSSGRNGVNNNLVATPPVSLSPAPSHVVNSSTAPSYNGMSTSSSHPSETNGTMVTTADNESRKSRSSSLVTTQVDVHSDKSSSASSSSPSPSLSPSFAASLYSDEGRGWETKPMTMTMTATTTTVPKGGAVDRGDRNDGLRDQLREEIKNRLGSSQSSPLSGAAAMMEHRRHSNNTGSPELLGSGQNFEYSDTVSNKVYNMFTATELDGRPLHSLVYNKKDDLGISVEGGAGTPLNGRILVAMVFDNGVAKKSGKMRVGDQLMSINGVKLTDVTDGKAMALIEEAGTKSGSKDMVELIFCESTLVNEEESMTYF